MFGIDDLLLLGLTAGGGILGAAKQANAKDNERKDALEEAGKERYSPLTGYRPQPVQRAPGALESVLGGLLQGALFGKQFSGLGASGTASAAPGGLIGDTSSMMAKNPGYYSLLNPQPANPDYYSLLSPKPPAGITGWNFADQIKGY